MTQSFDEALRPHDGPAEGEYVVEPRADWAYGRAVNGGFLMAVAARALRERVGGGDHVDPVALSAFFLTAATPGRILARTEVARRGRRLTTAQATLVQETPDGEAERVRVLASLGGLGTSDHVESAPPPPDMPPPQECVGHEEAWAGIGRPAPLAAHLDIRFDPETVGWMRGDPSGRGEIRGWLRLHDDRPVDTLALLLALDAMPPVSFELGIEGWAPTLEFTAHLLARPAPGWLRLATTLGGLADAREIEDGLAWDSTGRLVARSRQLAGVIVPDGSARPGR